LPQIDTIREPDRVMRRQTGSCRPLAVGRARKHIALQQTQTGAKVSKNTRRKMSTVWNTKFGPRRVRQEPPTLEEALFAARGFTDNLQEQVEFAASLMDMPAEHVKSELLKSGAQRKDVATVGYTARTGRAGAPQRAVVVERKTVRRPGVRRVVS
jgi:hypothetical protein